MKCKPFGVSATSRSENFLSASKRVVTIRNWPHSRCVMVWRSNATYEIQHNLSQSDYWWVECRSDLRLNNVKKGGYLRLLSITAELYCVLESMFAYCRCIEGNLGATKACR